MISQPDLVDLLLVGGGHTHLQVLRSFAMRPEPGVRVTLIAKEVSAPYSGMLPGIVSEQYLPEQGHFDLARLAQLAGARLVCDEVTALELAPRRVQLASGRSWEFDVISINSGIVPSLSAMADVTDRVIPVKPVSSFLRRWSALRDRLVDRVRANPDARIRVAVIGGGIAGVEMVLAMRAAVASPAVGWTLFEASERFGGATSGRRTSAALARVLEERGIDYQLAARVESVHANHVRLDDQRMVAADFVVFVTGAQAPSWLAIAGLDVDDDGFAVVGDTLQSRSHPWVFVAGDAASLHGQARPKAGVFAVRQGPYLAANLRRYLIGERPWRYRAQARHLSLISLSDRTALASRGGRLLASGSWVWRWKDLIDTRFMDRFSLRDAGMRASHGPQVTRVRFARRTAETMVCGGCGAKLGASSLARALAQIDAGAPSNVVIGARNADDAAVLAPSIHPLAVTVDGFRELVSDPFRFARIALNHAMGDAYAMGAQPSGVLATVTVRHADDVLKERDLSQVLKGIESMLKPIGVPLLGGHSAEGAEFNLGFTVLASLDGGHALRKDGLRPDDYIVLTKPLGTGVLFAAQMRGSARHEWLRDAMTGMERLLNVEAGLFVKHNVRGCTDVTGFGLLGHASEMARASNVVLDLAWDRVPVYNGALFCMAAGVHSSLQSNNEQAVDDYDVGTMSRSDPRLRILVDPQTCGGLLAGVAADDLHACLSELRVAGCDAWVIGRAFAASTGRTSRVAFGAQIAGLSDRRIGVCT